MQVPGEPALGFVGELHPLTARRYGFEDPVVVMELDLDRLCEQLGEAPRALPLSEFPPLRQDIAVVVADEHPASAVLAAVRGARGELLSDVQVFDVWRDAEALGPGRRSLALRLTFQAQDRTLSDEEVRPASARPSSSACARRSEPSCGPRRGARSSSRRRPSRRSCPS